MTTSRRTYFQSNATSDSTAPSSSENSTFLPASTTGLSSAVPSASLVASSLMTDSSIESSSLSQATALQSYTTASGSLSFVNPKPLLPGFMDRLQDPRHLFHSPPVMFSCLPHRYIPRFPLLPSHRYTPCLPMHLLNLSLPPNRTHHPSHLRPFLLHASRIHKARLPQLSSLEIAV